MLITLLCGPVRLYLHLFLGQQSLAKGTRVSGISSRSKLIYFVYAYISKCNPLFCHRCESWSGVFGVCVLQSSTGFELLHPHRSF